MVPWERITHQILLLANCPKLGNDSRPMFLLEATWMTGSMKHEARTSPVLYLPLQGPMEKEQGMESPLLA